MNDKNSSTKDQPVDSGTLAAISRGDKLVRMENETMQAIAVMRPREIEAVKAKAWAEVDAFPDMADRYYYSIPYRTKKCSHDIGQSCTTCEFVEGASIHAAQAIQRYWGNCSSSWEPYDEDEDHVWIKGRFIDFETNMRIEKTFRCSKHAFRWRKPDKDHPKAYRLLLPLDDRELVLAINAAGAKAQRNAILAGVPDPLIAALFQYAKSLIVGKEPQKKLTQKQIEDIANSFGKWGVSLEVLETKIGRPRDRWTMDDRGRMKGLYTALQDGEAAGDVFAAVIKPSAAKPEPEAKKSPDESKNKGKGKGKAKAEPKPEQESVETEPEQAPEADERSPFDREDFFG